MRKFLFCVIFLSLDLIIEGGPQRETRQLGKESMRPNITSLEEQRCQEVYQSTILEHTNKYRSLKCLKPLKVSKKLQYVALLTAQKSRVLGGNKARKSFLLFNTGWSTITLVAFSLATSTNEFKENAVMTASGWYDSPENWTALNKEENYRYIGCAVSFFDSTGYHVCYYQNDKGADKLKLNILPPGVNIDLESYNDSFWNQFQGKLNLKVIIIDEMLLFS